jgi:opacity protein-like surface antigen
LLLMMIESFGGGVNKLASLAGATLVSASLLFSAGVLAADLPIKAPPRAAWADSWAGPYIGAYFGAGAGRATESSTATTTNSFLAATNNVVTTNVVNTTAFASNLAGDMTGSMVDLFAGYNWRAGNFVGGGQIEGTVFSDVTLKSIGTQTFNSVGRDLLAGTTALAAGTITAQSNQQLRSRVGLIGRVGFLARPDVLLYGLGGLELGHFVFPDSADAFGGSNNKWVAGYTVGAGGEVKLTDNWSLRGEYRYLHFGFNRDATSASRQTSVQGASSTLFTDSAGFSQRINTDLHLGKIGMVYQFGDVRPLSAMAAMPPASGMAWGDSWAGPYIGAYFGAGAGRARETSTRTVRQAETNLNSTSTSTQSSAGNLAGDMTGSMVDLFAGYNWRTGNLVVGGQIEGTLFSDVTLKPVGNETFTSVQTFNGVVTSTSSGIRTAENGQQLRSNVGVVGRAGYLVTPNLLLYGLGGLALGHFTYPDGLPDSEDRVGARNGKWVAGYTVGAGGELKLTDNWSLRGEYRYLHFGFNRNEPQNETQTGGGSTSAINTADTRQINADFHTGKVGLVYRFGEGGPRSAMAAIPPAPGSAWSDGWAGPYVGAYFGPGTGRATGTLARTDVNANSFFANNVLTLTATNVASVAGNGAGDTTGSMVDLFAGYNWRAGNFVVGGQVEGTVFSDVALKTIGGQTFTSVATTNGVVTSTASTSATGIGEIQQQLRSNVGAIGRAGYLVTPNVLLYGLGGLALGHFTYPDAGDRTSANNGKWVAGYTIGAGGEVKLTDNWSLRGEYRYLHFGFGRDERENGSSVQQSGATSSTSLFSNNTAHHVNADFHTGKVGLVYRFGQAGPRSAMAAIPSGTARSDIWAGPYTGAYFAAGAGRARQTFNTLETSSQQNILNNVVTTNFVSSTPRIGNLAGDMTGSMVDLFAGYNWRTGNFVVGGQLEGTLFSDVAFKVIGNQTTTSNQVLNGVASTTVTNNTTQINEQLRSNFGAIGRAGYLVTPKLLLYGLGGLALGHFSYPDSTNVGGKNGKWVAGYSAGAGGELKLTERWSLRGEYRYVHFDVNRTEASASSSTTLQAGPLTVLRANSSNTARQTGADLHLGKLGAVYSFCYCD